MYRLNMIPKKETLEIFCSKGDTSLRRFIFELYNGDDPVVLAGSETIEFQQSNGAEHSCSIEDGKVILNAYEDMTSVPGIFRSRLKITETGGGVIHSAVFTLKIEEAA